MRMRSFLLCQVPVVVLAVFCAGNTAMAQRRERERDRDLELERDRNRNDGERQLGGAREQRERYADERYRDRAGDRPPANRRLVPPWHDEDRPWYLGVEVRYRDCGAQITRVERRSPAREAGLEVRDTIVTVDGYQVGRINGVLYTLDRELELRADRLGRVTLLVLNHRNGDLVPLPVRLESTDQWRDPTRTREITGTVSLSGSATLPRGAVLRVRLLDLTDRNLPARVIAQRTYRDPGPLPIPFELSFDRVDIQPDREYAMDAEVTVNLLPILRTPKRHPVLDGEEQGRVHMTLEPANR